MSNPFVPGRRSGLFIGRYFGIEFYLDASWFLIAAILTYTLAEQVFPNPACLPGRPTSVYYVLAAAAAFLFFLSILLHELGHSLVSQRCGIPVPRITLLFIGGVAEISREPDTAQSELKIALGGPAVSIILAGVYGGLAWIFSASDAAETAFVCFWLAQMNLFLVAFNMIPGYPLDGGRVLRAILWARSGRLRHSTFITSRIGIGFSWLLIAFGAFLILDGKWNGLIFFLIALFLKSAAESGYHNALQRETLADVKVRDLMTANPVAIPDHLPINLAVDDFFMTGHHVAYPVCSPDGEFRGLLRLDFLKEVPREKWPYVTAADVVAERNADDLCIGVEQSASRAMKMLLAPELNRLAVIEDGKLVGIVTRHDLLHFIKIHAELET
jgi:Zn-dependent protease/CBS domain-containing protein